MQIHWHKIGSPRLPNTASVDVLKSEDELTSVLRIANTLSYYSGSYYCIVKNEIGEAYSLQAQLHVKGNDYFAVTKYLCKNICIYKMRTYVMHPFNCKCTASYISLFNLYNFISFMIMLLGT